MSKTLITLFLPKKKNFLFLTTFKNNSREKSLIKKHNVKKKKYIYILGFKEIDPKHTGVCHSF